jgi:hypothetical protein
MKIQVNDQEIEIFNGANLRDVLWKYSKEEYHQIMDGKKLIVDKLGNQVLIDGEVDDGDEFYIKEA